MLKKEDLAKVNDVIANDNRKLMTEFITYLTTKNFYINLDEELYSKYPYHPDEIRLSGDSINLSIIQKSKKWIASEDLTLISNWKSYVSDQPAQFKRLSYLLLHKPLSYNILTDTIKYTKNMSNDKMDSKLCCLIKLKQLIIEYNRITRLYARLGKGIDRCLNSCYARAMSVIANTTGPILVGPFTEPEVQLCSQLYDSLRSSNTSPDLVLKQIGKSLNRSKEHIKILIDIIEQGTSNSLLGRAPIFTDNTRPQNYVPLMPPRPIVLTPVTPLPPKMATDVVRAVKGENWPTQVEEVFILAIKLDCKQRMGTDLDILSRGVSLKSLQSILRHLSVKWSVVLTTIAQNFTTFPPYHLEPCIPACQAYWQRKLKPRMVAALLKSKSNPSHFPRCDVPYAYDRTLVEAFLAALLADVTSDVIDDERRDVSQDVTLLGPKDKVHIRLRLLNVLKRYFYRCPSREIYWELIAARFNSALPKFPHMSPKSLSEKFNHMRYVYVPGYKTMKDSEVILALKSKYLPILKRKLHHRVDDDEVPMTAFKTRRIKADKCKRQMVRNRPLLHQPEKKKKWKKSLIASKKLTSKQKSGGSKSLKTDFVDPPHSNADDTNWNVPFNGKSKVKQKNISSSEVSQEEQPLKTLKTTGGNSNLLSKYKKGTKGKKETADPEAKEKKDRLAKDSIEPTKKKKRDKKRLKSGEHDGGNSPRCDNNPASDGKKGHKRKAKFPKPDPSPETRDEESSADVIVVRTRKGKRNKVLGVITLDDDRDDENNTNDHQPKGA